MLIAVKPLATVPNWPNKVHKARLQALQRHLGTRIDGDVAKVPCRVTVEMIQQMLARFRLHRFSAMYDMGRGAGPRLPSAAVSAVLAGGQKALLGNDLF